MAKMSLRRGVPGASFSYFGSEVSWVGEGFGEEALFHGDIPRTVPITKNVPVLRVDYRAIQGILFGVWEVIARSSSMNGKERIWRFK